MVDGRFALSYCPTSLQTHAPCVWFCACESHATVSAPRLPLAPRSNFSPTTTVVSLRSLSACIVSASLVSSNARPLVDLLPRMPHGPRGLCVSRRQGLSVEATVVSVPSTGPWLLFPPSAVGSYQTLRPGQDVKGKRDGQQPPPPVGMQHSPLHGPLSRWTLGLCIRLQERESEGVGGSCLAHFTAHANAFRAVVERGRRGSMEWGIASDDSRPESLRPAGARGHSVRRQTLGPVTGPP